jgi:hypothetical protein
VKKVKKEDAIRFWSSDAPWSSFNRRLLEMAKDDHEDE